MKRVGVDIGGTFTDLVLYDDVQHTIRRVKSPTTPSAPEEGLLAACELAGVEWSQVSYLMHATTLVTNLIITRSGAEVGLITTRGFRDVLEIGRSYKERLYDLEWDKPKHVVPRSRVVEVTERVTFDGHVAVPIDEDETRDAVASLVAMGVEAIAVCLLNSYANPAHELTVGRVLKAVAPQIYVSLSCEVDPRVREYERASTTALNAYAMPRIHGYCERLESSLGVDIKYMQSGGGVISSTIAKRIPIALAASGPAAGVLAARFLAEERGISNVITADVGGTSFDVCVIRDREPLQRDSVDLAFGIPARVQSTDVISIGAGGGSLVWIDAGGDLRIGPGSAGASPGPACYGLGGTTPTVTDANLLLGLINERAMLAGRLRLHPDLARRALEPIAKHVGLDLLGTALGIYKLVNAQMAQAISEATVRKGIDPRDFVLIAFGGAGGQHAAAIAEEVGMRQVLSPAHASTLSAFGLLTADLRYTVARTLLLPLDALDNDRLTLEFESLRAEAATSLVGQEAYITETVVEHTMDIRYIGQSNEVAIRIDPSMSQQEMFSTFEDEHFRRFGTRLGGRAEVVNLRTTVAGLVPSMKLASDRKATPKAKSRPVEYRPVGLYKTKATPVFDRDKTWPGLVLEGPCVIEELDTSVLVPKGWSASVDRHGGILMTRP